MEAFKIKHFERDHVGTEFPWFRELMPEETAAIRDRLARRLGFPRNLDDLEFARSIDRLCIRYEGKDAKSRGFDIMSVIDDLGIIAQEKIYVNWYRFDKIDEMLFLDFVRYFDDIWYPFSDDIELFDDSLSWLLSISHEGCLSAWKKAR